MKHSAKITACGLVGAALCVLGGCQLARADAGSAAAEDHLIGILITTEHLDLFDFESYVTDHSSGFAGGELTLDGGDDAKYQGRLYATFAPRTLTDEETGETEQIHEYVFDDTHGVSYFAATVPATETEEPYTTTGSDDAITDGHMNISYTDEGVATTMEGTLYVSPSEHIYYFNPVYQSADGSVYATAGSGFSAVGDHAEGEIYSQTMDETYTTTENGKISRDSISVTVSIETMYLPTSIRVLQMDADSVLLAQTVYASDEVPDTLTPVAGTDYLLVETHKKGTGGAPVITRAVYGSADESFSTFVLRADDIFTKTFTQIVWSSVNQPM